MSSSFESLTSEGDVTWMNNTGSTIPRGTVIIIENANDTDPPTIAVNIGTADETESGFNLSGNEQIYAFIGTRAAPTMISMIGVGNFGGDTPSALTDGSTALTLPGTTLDETIYNGSTTCNSDLNACLTQIYDENNWSADAALDYPDDVPTSFTGSVLPVELMAFSVKAQKNGVSLYWQTASELNNAGFEIHRSKDGQNWQKLTFVKGHGTTLETQKYAWLDENPLSGVNYYRLKQIDTDGRFEYSAIVSIAAGGKHEVVQVFPNPAADVLNYRVADLESVQRIQLFDAYGKLVTETADINGQLSLNGLPKGVYLFVLETTDGQVQQRVVKE